MSENPAHVLVELLSAKGLQLAVAESCTGGLLSDMITDVPGSSKVYKGGIVAYTRDAKSRVLGIPETALEQDGEVCEATAEAMARSAADKMGAQVSAGLTGNAGPTASQGDVGDVFIALHPSGRVEKFKFTGDRIEIKNRAALAALEILIDLVESL